MKSVPLIALLVVQVLWASLVSADIAAYVPNWANQNNIDISTLNYNNISQILYAFFTVSANGSVIPTLKANDDINIPKLNQLKSVYGFTTIASIGGWTNSTQFSQAFSTDAGRQNFVSSVVSTLINSSYAFDGIDIDWEYPDASGNGCNSKSIHDFQNFNTTLKLLRDRLGNRTISIAAGATIKVYSDVNGTNWLPIWARYLSYINVMTYDYSGNWNSHTGYNTPLFPSANDPLKIISINDTLNNYVNVLGINPSQLRLGLEFNGHSFYPINIDAAHPDGVFQTCPLTNASDPASGACTTIKGDMLDNAAFDGCNPPGYSGDWSWRGLRSMGVLQTPTQTVPNSGWIRTFHNSVMVPTLINPTSKVFINYDDVQSVTAKAQFARYWKLGGIFAWELSEDYYNSSSNINGELISAAVSAYQSGQVFQLVATSKAAPARTARTVDATTIVWWVVGSMCWASVISWLWMSE
ncbi:glycoside hydrolase superfamily [Polychytrium aggregatum]|uniref:glycoside hydrolase superfamily n=1 Tax=Polychytrium aggregatum TaxID=110093 RepID=UPI0022FDC98E|nr:glycoside hydrolase superfamily [Polychytrium aggregatum]KAI9204459.1 glycoside hydrolase superfamily [Polychytrium aggregatum]